MPDTIPALVVIHPFGAYSRGQIITDAAAITAIKDGGMASFTIATSVPAIPAAEAEKDA